MIKNCGQETRINSATDRPFALCSDCNDKSKQGKTLYKIDGSEWKTSARVDAREVDVQGSDGASSSTYSALIDGVPEDLCARTLSLVRRVQDENLEVKEGNAKQDPWDNLQAVLGRQ